MSNKKSYILVIVGMAFTAAAGIYLASCSTQFSSLGVNPQLPNQSSQGNATTPTAAIADRAEYNSIPLENIASSQSLKGTDPKAVAQAAFSNIESEGGARDVRVEYPQPDKSVVTIIQTGVADDSIGALRYRVELVPTSKSAQTDKEWKLVWAGSQVKCWPDRGHQNWSNQKCQ